MNRAALLLAGMMAAATLVGVLALLAGGEGRKAPQPTPPREAKEMQFLESYWRVPVPPQGPAPKGFSPLEASLAPESCGACHVQQFQDWQTSLHSRTMGPGVWGQLLDMREEDPETARVCYTCHTPLTEQQERYRPPGAAEDAPLVQNPQYDAALQAKGLVCAACHVRQHERFGPPKRDGTLVSAVPRDQLPHRGATRTPAFQRAEFCQGCHQFPADGYALNGKLLENTVNEWKASRYAKEGVTCQTCHMPDRRHLWRGIHDPDMARRGVTITVKTDKPRYAVGETLTAALMVANTGVGHFFPTYVTPKARLRMELIDAQGKPVAGTGQEAWIGREVTLDLAQEKYDTRIAPGKSFRMRYVQRVPAQGLRLRATVTVEPDHFYVGFFEALLQDGQDRKGRGLLEQALANARRSPFPIFTKEMPL